MEGSCCLRRAESSSHNEMNWNCTSQTYFSYALPKLKQLYSNSKDESINRFSIPEELLVEILLRLPAEFLIICKRVCKLWHNLINDPSFVNKHLHRVSNEHSKKSSSYPRTFLLKWIRQELSLDYIFAPARCDYIYGNNLAEHELSLVTVCDDDEDDRDGDCLPCVVEQLRLPPYPMTNGQVRFPIRLEAFHCNGIIHMFDKIRNDVAILLNPVLREFKLLQTPPRPPSDIIYYYSFAGSGFGYDPKANVYKYVKIYSGNFPSSRNPVALVYTMGTHSSWRMIEINDVEGNTCHLPCKGVYCKGAYFWSNDTCGWNTILSFDMSEEKFRSIPVPDHLCEGVTKKHKQLEVWKESVCCFFSPQWSWFSSTFEIWVMVDNFGGVEGSTSWTKHLTIGPLVCITFPLAFWRDDELLMEGLDGRIVSYNIYTQKIRRVPLPGAVLPYFTLANLCLNSLVSV